MNDIKNIHFKKLNRDQENEILSLYLEGYSISFLSKKYEKNPSSIHRLLNKNLSKDQINFARNNKKVRNCVNNYEEFKKGIKKFISDNQLMILKDLIKETIKEELNKYMDNLK